MTVTQPTRRGPDRERLLLEVRRASGPSVALLLLIVTALVSVYVIFKNIGISLPWQNTYQAEVALDNAKGIVAGEQTVRLAGVTIGRISAVQLINDRPVATITMDPKYGPLYRNATLTLRPETPLDDMYLDIVSRGTPSAGVLGANQILSAQRTQVPVDIGAVLDVFNADTRARVQASINALGEGLGTEGPAFKQALVELAPFLAAAKELTYQTSIRQGETRQLIHNLALVTTALGQRDTELRQLVANGASSLSELGNSESSVQGVINQLPATMSQLEATFAVLRSTENQLDPAFEALEPVAGALPAGLHALRQFATAAEPALARFDVPLPLLTDLMRQLSPTSSALKDSFGALKEVPSQLNTVTKLVLPCEAALADFLQNTLSLGKFSSNLSLIIRGETVAGLNSGAGEVNDLVAPKSCAPGGP